MDTFVAVIAFLAGLNIGSFLNVVIWRLPRGEMMAKKRSHCPQCGAQIAWYDNIPVISWILLRGRCRNPDCKARISARYPLVELLTAVLFLLAVRAYPDHLATAGLIAAYLAALVAITFIDLDHRIIPDKISKPGMAIAFLLAPINMLHHEPLMWFSVGGLKPALNAYIHAGAGLAMGAGVIYTIRFVASAILRKEAMGLGDVKLLALIGAVVGPLNALYSLAIGCLGGAIVGGVMAFVGKLRPMPCRLEITGRDLEEPAVFGRAKVRGDHLEVHDAPSLKEGAKLRVKLTLPMMRILAEEDETLELKGRVASAGDRTLRVALRDVQEADADVLGLFERSYKYIPFGPFLALGGAVTALYAHDVHWLLTEWYPAFARSLVTGGC